MSTKMVRETLAAIGVIASLMFVGYEIRQNTISARAAAYQEIGIATAAAFNSLAHDRKYLMSVQKDAGGMDSADWRQFGLKMTEFARLGETVLLQVEQGLLPSDAMGRLGYGGWKTLHESPKTACAWPLVRLGVGESFRKFVEDSEHPVQVDCSNFDLPTNLLF